MHGEKCMARAKISLEKYTVPRNHLQISSHLNLVSMVIWVKRDIYIYIYNASWRLIPKLMSVESISFSYSWKLSSRHWVLHCWQVSMACKQQRKLLRSAGGVWLIWWGTGRCSGPRNKWSCQKHHQGEVKSIYFILS